RAGVVQVRMGVDDVLRLQASLVQEGLDPIGLVSRIDQDRLLGGGITHHIGVLLEGADRGPGDDQPVRPASSPFHRRGPQAVKEVPQPQVALAFGLLNLKPAPWRLSTKSITVPSRKSMLCLSTATWMPPHS